MQREREREREKRERESESESEILLYPNLTIIVCNVYMVGIFIISNCAN